MGTTSRKQREIQQRETLLLDIAERMLLERGYLAISMDRIAEAAEYSKGTIYQHFTCKEDLMAAVLVRTVAIRERFFTRAATFRGRPRERMTAIGVADQIYTRLYPEQDRIERITKVESIWDKASQQRRAQFMQRDGNCLATVKGVIRDGVAAGDLRVEPPLSIEGLAFGLWSVAMGSRIIINHGLAQDLVEDRDPEEVLFQNYQVFLDGYAWSPLTRECDYPGVVQRIYTEVFADDARRAGLLTQAAV